MGSGEVPSIQPNGNRLCSPRWFDISDFEDGVGVFDDEFGEGRFA